VRTNSPSGNRTTSSHHIHGNTRHTRTPTWRRPAHTDGGRVIPASAPATVSERRRRPSGVSRTRTAAKRRQLHTNGGQAASAAHGRRPSGVSCTRTAAKRRPAPTHGDRVTPPLPRQPLGNAECQRATPPSRAATASAHEPPLCALLTVLHGRRHRPGRGRDCRAADKGPPAVVHRFLDAAEALRPGRRTAGSMTGGAPQARRATRAA
jgi:hypothetical protein